MTSKSTTMKTTMCDLASVFLAELPSLAKSIQVLPTIASPRSSQGMPNGVHSFSDLPPNLSRRNSLVGSNSRSASPARLDVAPHRMSMPPQLPSSASEPVIQGPGPPDSGTRSQTPPARTFEEITGLSANESRVVAVGEDGDGSGPRTSRDRVSVHGFGSGGINERNRVRGKGRVGIVIGTTYLIAGRWHDALRELVDSTMKARAYSDHLWHAKGLENILACIIMLAWAGLEFQVSGHSSLLFKGTIL